MMETKQNHHRLDQIPLVMRSRSFLIRFFLAMPIPWWIRFQPDVNISTGWMIAFMSTHVLVSISCWTMVGVWSKKPAFCTLRSRIVLKNTGVASFINHIRVKVKCDRWWPTRYENLNCGIHGWPLMINKAGRSSKLIPVIYHIYRYIAHQTHNRLWVPSDSEPAWHVTDNLFNRTTIR